MLDDAAFSRFISESTIKDATAAPAAPGEVQGIGSGSGEFNVANLETEVARIQKQQQTEQIQLGKDAVHSLRKRMDDFRSLKWATEKLRNDPQEVAKFTRYLDKLEKALNILHGDEEHGIGPKHVNEKGQAILREAFDRLFRKKDHPREDELGPDRIGRNKAACDAILAYNDSLIEEKHRQPTPAVVKTKLASNNKGNGTAAPGAVFMGR